MVLFSALSWQRHFGAFNAKPATGLRIGLDDAFAFWRVDWAWLCGFRWLRALGADFLQNVSSSTGWIFFHQIAMRSIHDKLVMLVQHNGSHFDNAGGALRR